LPLDASSVTAVVVSHDSAHCLPACLAAVAASGVQAIVVDNASRDGSAISQSVSAHG